MEKTRGAREAPRGLAPNAVKGNVWDRERAAHLQLKPEALAELLETVESDDGRREESLAAALATVRLYLTKSLPQQVRKGGRSGPPSSVTCKNHEPVFSTLVRIDGCLTCRPPSVAPQVQQRVMNELRSADTVRYLSELEDKLAAKEIALKEQARKFNELNIAHGALARRMEGVTKRVTKPEYGHAR